VYRYVVREEEREDTEYGVGVGFGFEDVGLAWTCV
jgi:hypothetical protein